MRKFTDEQDRHIYSIWRGMKRRCYEPNRKDFKWYGGKGITVCNEWLNSYEGFKEWALTNGYKCGLTIDRIDNKKRYEPSNCQWITQSENSKKRQAEAKNRLLQLRSTEGE